MAALCDVILDKLQSPDVTDLCEIELRMRVVPAVLHTIRNQLFGATASCSYSSCQVRYNDKDDIRCIDGSWQSKRTILFYALPCAVSTNLAVSVESAARQPMHLGWTTIQRDRWSYAALDQWRVDFTTSDRSTNIEIEYTGKVDQLAEGVSSLRALLRDIHACLVYSTFGRTRGCHGGTAEYPFVRLDIAHCPVTAAQRCQDTRMMQQCQPVSLCASSSALPRPLVSLKYDGSRMLVRTVYRNGQWVAIGTCRKGMPWLVPCLSATSEMVLDCEYVHRTQTFVVFDIFTLRGVALQECYSQRLQCLARLDLPVLACQYKMARKAFYPLGVLSDQWYEKQCAEHDVDGVIIHDGTSKLGSISRMYKWKPVHTVDLYVGENYSMMDGKYTEFLPLCVGHNMVLRKGDIWECEFVLNGTQVRPVRLRTDKARANARHVCREILRAHRDQLTVDQVVCQMTQISSIRTSKRKRV